MKLDARQSASETASRPVDDENPENFALNASTGVRLLQKTRNTSLREEPVWKAKNRGRAATPKPQSGVETRVNGTALSIDDTTVRAEIVIGEKHVMIQLPRELFPNAVSYGYPFYLEMSEINGIRQPMISERTPSATPYREQAEVLEAMLARL